MPDTENGNGKIAWPNISQSDAPTGIDQYTDSDNYKGYVLDPYNKLSEKCTINTTARNTKVIPSNLNIDARWLDSYWQATSGQPLAGFSFPAKVNFGNPFTSLIALRISWLRNCKYSIEYLYPVAAII